MTLYSSDYDDYVTISSASDSSDTTPWYANSDISIARLTPTGEGGPVAPKYATCQMCCRTYRENLLQQHVEDFHKQVQCSQCGQAVDRSGLRRHKEQSCPRRLRICPHCYLQVEDADLKGHLYHCSPPHRQLAQRKEKVEDSKGLSFKGTVFDDHSRIAKKFINIARGHPEKPPFNLVVKAGSKNHINLIPTVEDIVDALCPPNFSNSFELKQISKNTNIDPSLLYHIAGPLQNAFANYRRRNERLQREVRRKRSVSKAAVNQNLDPEDESFILEAVQAPEKARRLREVHQSLAKRFREDCHRRKFVRHWLQAFFVDKNDLNEIRVRREELTEDAIIDEAIELELKKEMLQRIPREKWSSFVDEIQKRRGKWQDLGFSIEDCPRSSGSGDSRSLDVGKVEIVEDDGTEIPYWKLVESNMKGNGKPKATAVVSTVGFYKSCQSCWQLFHEDHLSDHMASCKPPKDHTLRKRRILKDSRSLKKSVSHVNRHVDSGSVLRIPPPLGANERCSTLALSIAPHAKHYRWGKSKYAFITTPGRV